MDRSDEDALWRSIVENYGERADLDDTVGDHDRSARDPGAGAGSDTGDDAGEDGAADTGDATGPGADRGGVDRPEGRDDTAGDVTDPAGPGETDRADGADHADARAAEAARLDREFDERHEVPDRFTPPEPPPLPYVAPSRLLAWAALVGGPLVLVLSLTVGFGLSGFWRLVAALAFVGGFVYLVARMPRDPRDPWDDGARV